MLKKIEPGHKLRDLILVPDLPPIPYGQVPWTSHIFLSLWASFSLVYQRLSKIFCIWDFKSLMEIYVPQQSAILTKELNSIALTSIAYIPYIGTLVLFGDSFWQSNTSLITNGEIQ